jgi:hypothetical protein
MAILEQVSKYTWERGIKTCAVPGELVRHVGGGFVVTAIAGVGCPGGANCEEVEG